MEQRILDALETHFEAHILKHQVNIEVLLANPTAIPEHVDIMEAIELELAKMAEYKDKLEALKEHFI